MNKLINRLPIEIIQHILSYSYTPQPIPLQKDIISYVNTRKEIMDIFHRRYHTVLATGRNIIYKHLTFHIQCFLTGIPNIYEKNSNILEEVCTRLFIWNRLLGSDKIIVNNRFSHNVLWGLLTVEEREHFLKIQKNMDNTRMP